MTGQLIEGRVRDFSEKDKFKITLEIIINF